MAAPLWWEVNTSVKSLEGQQFGPTSYNKISIFRRKTLRFLNSLYPCYLQTGLQTLERSIIYSATCWNDFANNRILIRTTETKVDYTHYGLGSRGVANHKVSVTVDSEQLPNDELELQGNWSKGATVDISSISSTWNYSLYMFTNVRNQQRRNSQDKNFFLI